MIRQRRTTRKNRAGLEVIDTINRKRENQSQEKIHIIRKVWEQDCCTGTNEGGGINISLVLS